MARKLFFFRAARGSRGVTERAHKTQEDAALDRPAHSPPLIGPCMISFDGRVRTGGLGVLPLQTAALTGLKTTGWGCGVATRRLAVKVTLAGD